MLLLERNRNNSNSKIPSKAGSFFYLPIFVIMGLITSNMQSGPCCSKQSTAVAYNDSAYQEHLQNPTLTSSAPTGSVTVKSDSCASKSPSTKSFESVDLDNKDNTKKSNSSLNNLLPPTDFVPISPCNSPASVQSPESTRHALAPSGQNPRMVRILKTLLTARSTPIDSNEAPF